MKNARNKTLTAITLVLTLTFTSIFVALPIANAADEYPTFAFLTVDPNPIGVGQLVYVGMWLNKPPPTASGAYGDRWEGFELSVTMPDGSTQIIGTYDSDPIGGAWTVYTPTQAGKYSFQMSYPGQTLAGDNPDPGAPNTGEAYIGAYFKPSTSKIVELTVQEDAIAELPTVEAPTYWERPLYAENKELSYLGSNWLMAGYNTTSRSFDAGSAFAPYNKAPDSAHILWTRPLTFGGLVGAEYGTTAYYQGMSYEAMFTPAIIINGRLYYNTPTPPRYGFYCVDLTTGETIYYKNGTYYAPYPYGRSMGTGGQFPGTVPLSFGQILDYESPNQHGALAYLWSMLGSDWLMFDAFTGNYILTIENVPSGTIAFGPKGELMVYTFDEATDRLTVWNSTRAIPPPSPVGSGAWQWRPDLYREEPLDGTVGIQLDVTVPEEPGTQMVSQIGSDAIYLQTERRPATGFIAYDKNTGAKLWSSTINTAEYPIDASVRGMSPFLISDGVYVNIIKDTIQLYGYDVQTGDELWGPINPYPNDWGFYAQHTGSVGAYGNFYTGTYTGTVHAIDLKTGKEGWEYSAGSAGFETPYGTWPFYGGLTIADGKVFAATGEHSPGTPLWKGEKLHVIDAYEGTPLWNISGWYFGHTMIVADGKLVAHNAYDNQLYCFGKGPSETTVTVSSKVVAKGSQMLIEGTVLDMTPAQEGTPCVSKDSMSAWMEYLHMQKPLPMDATGVPVKLEAFGEDGSYIDIGTVTTDCNGFRHAWTPPDEGTYTIIATFYGDDSYSSSWGATGLLIGPEVTPSGQIEPEEQPFITTEVAIIVAVAVAVVVGIVAFWALKKRK